MKDKGALAAILALICCSGFLCHASTDAREIALPQKTAAQATAKVEWVKFQDPLEQAFTIEVPQGWSVKGGMFRLGYSDYRAMVDMKSPGGETDIRLGDVAIPSYSLPTRFHQREGDLYDLGAQAQLTVARYRTGQQFAALYAKSRFGSLCQNLTAKESEGPAPVQDIAIPSGGGQSQSGDATYECRSGAATQTAYAYARTTLSQGLWQVTMLASFIAPAGQTKIARGILLHCSQTLQLNPRWIQYQKQMDEEELAYQRQRQQARIRQLSQQAAQFESRMQSMQNQVNAFERGEAAQASQVNAFESRQAAQAKQVEGFTNVLVGITPTTDPLGNERDVWTGPKNSYWINGLGQTVNSDNSPGPGWQQLTPKP